MVFSAVSPDTRLAEGCHDRAWHLGQEKSTLLGRSSRPPTPCVPTLHSHLPTPAMSRSFFSPDAGQSSSSPSSSSADTRLNLGGAAGGAGSSTPDYGRSSSPPLGNRDEARVPFLNGNGRSDDPEAGKRPRAGRSASVSGASGESLAGLKALPPILSYCSASILMTVINKVGREWGGEQLRAGRAGTDYTPPRPLSRSFSLLSSSSCLAHTSQ